MTFHGSVTAGARGGTLDTSRPFEGLLHSGISEPLGVTLHEVLLDYGFDYPALTAAAIF